MSRSAVAVAVALVAALLAACSKKEVSDTSPTTGSQHTTLPTINDPTKPGSGAPLDTGAGGMTPANDSSYKLAVASPPGAAGTEAVARVTVTPSAGWHMNKEFPTRLELTAPEGVQVTAPKGVKLQKAVFELTDVTKLDDNELAFDVKLVAARAGTFKVGGEIKFAVCTADTCDPKKQPIAFELVAQ